MKKTVFISICIALIVGVSCKSKRTIEQSEAYPANYEDANDAIRLAADAVRDKEYKKACFYYQKYVEQTEDSAYISLAYYNWSLVLYRIAAQTKDKKYKKEGLQKIEKAVEFDNSNYLNYRTWGLALSEAARDNNDNKKLFALCLEKYQKAAELNPDIEIVQLDWADNLLYVGILQKNKALIAQSIEKYDKVTNRKSGFYNNYGLALLYTADIDNNIPQNKQSIEEMLFKADKLGSNEASEGLACLYAKIGDSAEALKWLEKYLDNDGKLSRRDIKTDFNDLRKDKRFKDLLKRYDYKK